MCVYVQEKERETEQTNRTKDAEAKMKYFLHVEEKEFFHHWSILNSL